MKVHLSVRFVYLIHIILGAYLIYVGFQHLNTRPRQKKILSNYEYMFLILLGIIAILYHSYLWLTLNSNKLKFHLSPKFVYPFHILVGALFIYIGYQHLNGPKKDQTLSNYEYKFLILLGIVAISYHSYLWLK